MEFIGHLAVTDDRSDFFSIKGFRCLYHYGWIMIFPKGADKGNDLLALQPFDKILYFWTRRTVSDRPAET